MTEDLYRRGGTVRIFERRELEGDSGAGDWLRRGVRGLGLCAGSRAVRLCVVRGIWRELRGLFAADDGPPANSRQAAVSDANAALINRRSAMGGGQARGLPARAFVPAHRRSGRRRFLSS